ncbi:MAG: HlyD family efflux transporter periplasmic adaptor subunit [Candidatus Kapaibacterium sp.]
MDIIHESRSKQQRRKRIAITVLGIALIPAIFWGTTLLRPAAPTVERGTLWIDTVRRGTMLRQVRGLGTLVPEETWLISATVDGRVEKIIVQPGTIVTANTVLIELNNPQLQQEALETEWQLKAALAEYRNIQVRLESERLDHEATVATMRAESRQATLQSETSGALNTKGLATTLESKGTEAKAEEFAARYDIEKKRLDIHGESAKAQLAVQKSRIEQLRALAALKHIQVESLHVRAGIDGVLQQLPLQVGQQIVVGTTMAKVAQPSHLKAELKIAETQAKDIQTGQPVQIDTRNGIIPGRVTRIDPAVQNGTVTIDVALDGTLPRGARPDLTVDGTIELERLTNILYIGRPTQGGSEGSTGLFKVDQDNRGATRVRVQLGRSSVSTIEVLGGLREGDRVLLSDMSAMDGADRIAFR